MAGERRPPMPVSVPDLLTDMMFLTTEERGLLCSLVFFAWRRGPRPLPDDERQLAQVAGLSIRPFRRLWPRVSGFFERVEGGWLPTKLSRFGYGDVPQYRAPLPDEVRQAVWAKTGGSCSYCGVGLTVGRMCPTEFTVDHVHPFSRGGHDDLDNLVPACRACNSRKGASLQ